MTNYDSYNREERAICSHLFRLLHENLSNTETNPLKHFLEILSNQQIVFNNFKVGLSDLRYENIGIYCEVAIIRDAYENKKPLVNPFLDEMTQIIMKQESVSNCRLYSQLPEPLSNQKLTHPKQIRQKASDRNIDITEEEMKVFGAMQGMFNAKPDLVITIDNKLLVIEAKFTEPFNYMQLKRTENISEVWSKLLYRDFGFSAPPEYSIIKLGPTLNLPHISWTDILSIAEKTYSPDDRSLISFKAGVNLLKYYRLEQ